MPEGWRFSINLSDLFSGLFALWRALTKRLCHVVRVLCCCQRVMSCVFSGASQCESQDSTAQHSSEEEAVTFIRESVFRHHSKRKRPELSRAQQTPTA
eukprot:COSAG05_NODE_3608_length_1963_cov_2.475858_1_plen_98_part_00